MAANASSTAATATSKSTPSKKEKDTLIAVLQFLKKSKLSVSCRSTSSKKQPFLLKKCTSLGAREFVPYRLAYCTCTKFKLIVYDFYFFCKETEKIFRQEVNCLEAIEEINLQTTPDSEPDISSVLSAYNR